MLAPAILRTPGESTSKTPPSTAIGQEVTLAELSKYERLIPWDQQWVSRSKNRVSSTILRGLLRPSPMEMEVPPLSLIWTLLTFSSRFFSTTLQTTTEARCGSETLIPYKFNLQSFAIVQHSGTEVYAHTNIHAIELLFPSSLFLSRVSVLTHNLYSSTFRFHRLMAIFVRCTHAYTGGVLVENTFTSLRIVNNLFENNVANDGGGFFIDDSAPVTTQVVELNEFNNNFPNDGDESLVPPPP